MYASATRQAAASYLAGSASLVPISGYLESQNAPGSDWLSLASVLPAGTMWAAFAVGLVVLALRWTPSLQKRFELRTTQLSDEKAKTVGTSIARQMNGELITFLRESKPFEAIVDARALHKVNNRLHELGLLDLKAKIDQHVVEDTEAHERIARLEANVTNLKDDLTQMREEMREDARETQRAARDLAAAVGKQETSISGQFQSITSEFRNLRELLENAADRRKRT